MYRRLTLYTRTPLRHELESRFSRVQVDILSEAFCSHGILEILAGIDSLDSPREIPGSVLCDFGTDRRKRAICERGPRRLKRLPLSQHTGSSRSLPRGAASMLKVSFEK